MNIKIGESLNLVAKVDGFPVPECLWYFGDNLMQQTELAKFEVKGNTFSLNLFDCKTSDSGVYKLFAKNSVGSASTEATIDILGNEYYMYVL